MRSTLITFITSVATLSAALVTKRFEKNEAIGSRETLASSKPPVLVPINVDVFQSAAGLQVRDAVDFSRLDPADQAHLVYGTPGDGDDIMLANMTLYAPDGQLIVLMESFEGLTKSVDCNDNDGILSLTFNDQAAYQYAMSKWSYINQDADQTFLLIANNEGCGPDEQRAVYTVTDIHDDATNFVTYFNAAPASWSEVTGTFDMDFGQAVLAPGASRRLRSRGFFSSIGKTIGNVVDDVTDDIKSVGNAIIGNVDFSKSVNFPCDIGTPNTNTKIFADTVDNVSLDIECSNCFLAGTLQLVGTVKVSSFSLQELSLEMSPTDFKAALEVTTTVAFQISESASTHESKSINLLTVPVPGAGLSIPEIFTLGCTLGLDAGFDITFKSSFTFTLGMDATLPEGGKIIMDLAHLDQAGATGFEGITVNPIAKVDQKEVSISGDIYLAPKIAFDISVLALGKAEAAILLDLPKITADATLLDSNTGACAGSADEYGVSLAVDASLALVGQVSGDIAGLYSKSWSTTLYSIDLYKNTFCFPFGGSAAGVTSSPLLAIDAAPTTFIPTSIVGASTTPAVLSVSSAQSSLAASTLIPAVSQPSTPASGASVLPSAMNQSTTAFALPGTAPAASPTRVLLPSVGWNLNPSSVSSLPSVGSSNATAATPVGSNSTNAGLTDNVHLSVPSSAKNPTVLPTGNATAKTDSAPTSVPTELASLPFPTGIALNSTSPLSGSAGSVGAPFYNSTAGVSYSPPKAVAINPETATQNGAVIQVATLLPSSSTPAARPTVKTVVFGSVTAKGYTVSTNIVAESTITSSSTGNIYAATSPEASSSDDESTQSSSSDQDAPIKSVAAGTGTSRTSLSSEDDSFDADRADAGQLPTQTSSSSSSLISQPESGISDQHAGTVHVPQYPSWNSTAAAPYPFSNKSTEFNITATQQSNILRKARLL